jgi:hypothetical protein
MKNIGNARKLKSKYQMKRTKYAIDYYKLINLLKKGGAINKIGILMLFVLT